MQNFLKMYGSTVFYIVYLVIFYYFEFKILVLKYQLESWIKISTFECLLCTYACANEITGISVHTNSL